MGFIPIILTMSGAILLFFMAVNQSFLAKKNTILKLQQELLERFRALGKDLAEQPDIATPIPDQIDDGFHFLRSHLAGKEDARFEREVKAPYRDMKVTIDQYNRLVKKKPYSFVAKLMGHKAIGK